MLASLNTSPHNFLDSLLSSSKGAPTLSNLKILFIKYCITVFHRYSDFHVHELSIAGTTVRLTNFSIPEEIKKVPQFYFIYVIVYINSLQEVTNLDAVFSADDVEKLRTLSENCGVDEVVRIKVSLSDTFVYAEPVYVTFFYMHNHPIGIW